MIAIRGVVIKKLTKPKLIKTVQPTAHFISGDNPHIDIVKALVDNMITSKKDIIVIAHNGNLILSFILISDTLN